MSRLITILGDQLSHNLSSLRAADKSNDILLFMEVLEEATYVKHHKKKIAFILSAMRHFANELRLDGWKVDYVTLSDKRNEGSFTKEVDRAIKRHEISSIIVTEPSEYRVKQSIEKWADLFSVPVEVLEDERFLCSVSEFQSWAKDRKQLRMEYFYRDMRRKTGLLMDGNKPIGGKWNFDAENRLAAEPDLFMPRPYRASVDQDTRKVLSLVEERFSNHFGDLEPFWFAVTHAQAETALEQFIQDALPRFGDFQDAMLLDEKFLYHSILALYINIGLLDPLKVCRAAETAFHQGLVPLNAVEGFIRQIIGWREYVRGVYWLKMPAYAEENYFSSTRDLPQFYWTGDTDMQCLRSAISQTKEEAYAHHIQRLMITGNFALLIGVEPKLVHEWYLAVYADAFEWVELPNTLGMSQFADGGLLGSKPYASSGNYINKMSDYCKSCKYKVKKKIGEDACPFNSLYWQFLDRNDSLLRKNGRMSQMYRIWDKMDKEQRSNLLITAQDFIAKLYPS